MVSKEIFYEFCVTIDFGDITLEQLSARTTGAGTSKSVVMQKIRGGTHGLHNYACGA